MSVKINLTLSDGSQTVLTRQKLTDDPDNQQSLETYAGERINAYYEALLPSLPPTAEQSALIEKIKATSDTAKIAAADAALQ